MKTITTDCMCRRAPGRVSGRPSEITLRRAGVDSCDLGLFFPLSAAGYWLDWLGQEVGTAWVKQGPGLPS